MSDEIKYAEYTEGICNDGGAILKDGHKMFIQDVVRDLNRKSYLEELFVALRAENEKLRNALNPRTWSHESSSVWHKNIPDTMKAFEELLIAAPKGD